MLEQPPKSLTPETFFASIGAARIWLRPIGFLAGKIAAVELLARGDGEILSAAATLPALRDALLQQSKELQARFDRAFANLAGTTSWAGFDLGRRPLIMGIVNVTPDSFSDGGAFATPETAIAQGRKLVTEGADIVDVGGESTRPGAAPVSPEEELRRVDPVVRGLAAAGAIVSIDTRHAAVMEAALAAGARIVNDVSALASDGSVAVVARRHTPVVLMHMQGEPRTMQTAPRYTLPSLDIAEYLEVRIAACEAAGIRRGAIAIDPGIGFGKSRADNLEILARLGLLRALGCAVMVGVSRKSFLGPALPAAERLAGSLAAALQAWTQGAQILRVHDVAATRQALDTAQAIQSVSGAVRW